MLKLLRKLDRKAESFINEMDRTLQHPISRATTFNAFRRDDTRSVYPVDQPVIADVDSDTHCLLGATVDTSSVPASPKAANGDSIWDNYPPREESMCSG